MCAPVSQTRFDLSEAELFDDSNLLSRRHCRSPIFSQRFIFSQEQGMCAPVSHQKVNFLMIQAYLPGNTIGLGLLRVRQTHINYKLHPSHVEMLNAIRGRLHLEVPQVECLVAPVVRNLLNRLLGSRI